MTRVSDARTEDTCHDRLAARVFGSLGLASVNVLAALARDRSLRRTAGRHTDGWDDLCRPTAGEAVAMAFGAEVSLREALSDPIVVSLMAADRVDPTELEESLEVLAKKLARRRANARRRASGAKGAG